MYLSLFCPLLLIGIISYLKKYKLDTYESITVLGLVSFILFYLGSINFLLVFAITIIFLVVIIFNLILNFDKYFECILDHKLYLVVAISYSSLAFGLYGYGDGIGHRIAISLWPSVDNNIYFIVAEKLCLNGARAWNIPIFGPIPLADRVPAFGILTTPLYCLFRSESLIFSVGVAIQALWVIPIKDLLDLYKKPNYYILIIISSPIIIFYTIYLWWKILAATYLIMALNRFLLKKDYGYFLPLAFITHPGSSYSFPFFIRPLWPTGKTIGSCSLVIIITLFAIIELHPTGQILRWHLFGNIDVEASFYSALKDAYLIDFDKFLSLKFENIKNTFFPLELASVILDTKAGHQGLILRYMQLYGIYCNIVIYLFLLKYNLQIYDKQLIIFIITSICFTVIVEYGADMSEAILHHRSFAELIVAMILVATHVRGLFFLIIGISINIFNFIFIWNPLSNVDFLKFEINYQFFIIPIISIIALYYPLRKL